MLTKILGAVALAVMLVNQGAPVSAGPGNATLPSDPESDNDQNDDKGPCDPDSPSKPSYTCD